MKTNIFKNQSNEFLISHWMNYTKIGFMVYKKWALLMTKDANHNLKSF